VSSGRAASTPYPLKIGRRDHRRISPVRKENISNICKPFFTRAEQCSVFVRVHIGAGLQQARHDLSGPCIHSIHERLIATMVHIRPCLQQQLDHSHMAPKAGSQKRCFGIGVHISALLQEELDQSSMALRSCMLQHLILRDVGIHTPSPQVLHRRQVTPEHARKRGSTRCVQS